MSATRRTFRPLLIAALLLGAVIVWAFIASVPGGSGTTADAPADRGDPDADPAERRGALVDQIVFTRESDPGRAIGLINRGTHQVYTDGVTSTALFQRLRTAEGTAHSSSYGSSVELTLNPSGPYLNNGQLNPFAFPEVREAMNRLVNRRYVAEEIYGGLAVPRYLPISTAFPDYARLADVARELELRYQHNPQRAEAAFEQAMTNLGASRENGRWTYDGEPVRLSVLIRTEDERNQVGDYVANLLEDIGFAVDRRYRTADEASRIWIARDPADGGWHIYTGGWISTAINRDQAQNFADYYTPLGRGDPLWQAYEPEEAFFELAERLQRRDYETWEQRQEMMAEALERAMADSARVWLVDQLNVWPRSREVALSTDLAGGVAGSALWPYTVRYRDRVGGNMRFATPNLLTEPWNPVAGSNWIFDQMILRATRDPAVLPDPFTGLFRPQRLERAEVTVRDGVPVSRTLDWLSLDKTDEIRVPNEAWVDWDADNETFITAEDRDENRTARTRVRLHYETGYLQRHWHDGSPVSVADLVLPMILQFARADEGSLLFDPSHVPDFEAFQRHFRGWHIVSTDPLVIDVYSDQIYPDAETIVAQRIPVALPWHTLTLGVLAEQRGELAFSSSKADRMQVEWLSMVSGPSLPRLDRILESARERRLVPYPNTLGEWIDDDAAEARYEAIHQWRSARGHFWIGDGPFKLHAVYPVEGSLVLRRFEGHPDPADKWLRFAEAEIPELRFDGPLVLDGSSDARFRLNVTFEGRPIPSDTIESVQYLLFDGRSELRKKANAEYEGAGRWSIQLDADTLRELGTGSNSLEVAVTSRRVALPSFASHAFATVPEGTELEDWDDLEPPEGAP